MPPRRYRRRISEEEPNVKGAYLKNVSELREARGVLDLEGRLPYTVVFGPTL